MDDVRAVLDADPDFIPEGARVLVGLSGGGDSLALLHVLIDLAQALRLDVRAAHFDHGARPDSAAQAHRVREWAAAAGVECIVGRADAVLSGQHAFREARLAFLEASATAMSADRIATAHQLEDQLETILLRQIRGTGLRGLSGIPARRGRFVRPLLGISRDRLREFLEGRGVAWIEDPSNTDSRYTRARVRSHVLPLLRRAAERVAGSPEGPGLDRLLLRTAADARCADAKLDARTLGLSDESAHVVAGSDDIAAHGAQIARIRPGAYDPAVLARILRMRARNKGIRLSRGGTRIGVEFIRRGSSGHAVDIGGGLRLLREYDRFRLVETAARAEMSPDREIAIETCRAGTGTAKLGGRVYEVTWGSEQTGRSGWKIRLDAALLSFPLRVRGPRPGDRIRTRAGSRKLKKVLNERRVPRSRRAAVPVLEGADGRLLWVAGLESRDGAIAECGTRSFQVEVVGRAADGR